MTVNYYRITFTAYGERYTEILTCATAAEAQAIIQHFNPTAQILAVKVF